jgi:hypothetical protein
MYACRNETLRPAARAHVEMKTLTAQDNCTALATRPEDIDVATDWIRPGTQADREVSAYICYLKLSMPLMRKAIITMLVDAGADIEAPDYHNFSLLVSASLC